MYWTTSKMADRTTTKMADRFKKFRRILLENEYIVILLTIILDITATYYFGYFYIVKTNFNCFLFCDIDAEKRFLDAGIGIACLSFCTLSVIGLSFKIFVYFRALQYDWLLFLPWVWNGFFLSCIFSCKYTFP